MKLPVFFLFFIERRTLIQMLGFLSMHELKIEEPYHEIVSLLRERSREYTEKSCMINQEIGSYTNKNISIQMNQFLQQKYQIGSRSWNYLCFSYFFYREENAGILEAWKVSLHLLWYFFFPSNLEQPEKAWYMPRCKFEWYMLWLLLE
jgi:hypothetical protein